MGAGASTPSSPPSPTESSSSSASAGACPVDDKTRAAWLSQNQNQNQGSSPRPNSPSDSPSSAPTAPRDSDSQPPSKRQRQLSQDREISSIPRVQPNTSPKTSRDSFPAPPSPYAQQQQQQQQQLSRPASHGTPSNAESETGHDASSGNWVYPSERQFFDALVRKGTPNSTTSAGDLATSVASIIPIHNAVNERAWSEIQSWESAAPTSDPGSRKCGGPRLYSFRGLGVDSQYLSPRARINGALGYQLPFDRHDWAVERCGGERVEYVIDFYQGKGGDHRGRGAGAANGKLNFYLDVRPKLNSWEGWRMRMTRLLGL